MPFTFYLFKFLITLFSLLSLSIFESTFLIENFLYPTVWLFFPLMLVFMMMNLFLFLVLWAGVDLIEDLDSLIFVLLLCFMMGIFFSSLSSMIYLMQVSWILNVCMVTILNFIMIVCGEYVFKKYNVSKGTVESLVTALKNGSQIVHEEVA